MCRTVLVMWRMLLVLSSSAALGHECSHWNRRTFLRAGEEVPLYVGAMFTSVEESTFAGSAETNLRPATDLALRDIASHPCVLNGYNLTLVSKDSQCKASMGMKSFFDMISDEKHILAIFGGACTKTNQLVAMATNFWHKVQLSYAEDHPMFASRDSQDLYGTFYRVVPSHYNHILARINFLRHFNWAKVSALVQNDDSRYALLMETFTTTLEREHGIAVLTSTGFSSKKMNIKQSLAALEAKDARIIVGEFSPIYAGAVFCQAYYQKLYGEEYVWIIGGYHDAKWWRAPSVHLPCSRLQLLEALEGHFVFEFSDIRSDDTMVVSDKTAQHYLREYQNMCREPNCRYSNYHGYVYDGLWAIALAFERVITDMLIEGMHFKPDRTLLHSDYGTKVWRHALMTALSELQFEGVTGQVRFRENERLGKIRIMQFINQSYVNIGEFDAAVNKLFINESRISWKTGSPPADSIQETFIRRYIEYSVFCIMCSVVAICMCVAFGLLATNIYFRDHKFIKMSSPYMNNLIILGSIVTYCSVILLGIDTRMVPEEWYGTVCTAKVWTLSLGFTLSFGSMFSKTWRVHSIFTDVHLNKKAITDYKLYLLVGVLLLVDAVILITWLVLDPMKMAIKRMPIEKNLEENLIINPTIEHCKAEHAVVFQGLLYGYKGIMLVLGCFLAWETRNVNVPALNDSKYIGMSVYNVVLICAVGVAISFILHDQVNECYIIISMFIIFCTTLTLGLVFVPKIVELIQSHRNPNSHHSRTVLRSLYALNKSRLESKDLRDKKTQEEKENRKLKKHLNQMKRETAILVKIIARCSVLLESEAARQPRRKSIRPDDSEPYGGVYIGPSEYCTNFLVENCEDELVDICEAISPPQADGLEEANAVLRVQHVQSHMAPADVVKQESPFVVYHRRRRPAAKTGCSSLETLWVEHNQTVPQVRRQLRGSEPPSACYNYGQDDSDEGEAIGSKQTTAPCPSWSSAIATQPRKWSLRKFLRQRSNATGMIKTSISLFDALQDWKMPSDQRKLSFDEDVLLADPVARDESQRKRSPQGGEENIESLELAEIFPSYMTG